MSARAEPATSHLPALLERRLREFGDADPEFVVVLFGSRARGDAWRDSDYDLLVVARAFEGVPALERGRMLAASLWDVAPVDLICVTPTELARATDGFGITGIALRSGIRVLP